MSFLINYGWIIDDFYKCPFFCVQLKVGSIFNLIDNLYSYCVK